jgi:hypothetical protein
MDNFCKGKNTTKCIFIFMSHNMLWPAIKREGLRGKKKKGKKGIVMTIGFFPADIFRRW